jgi:FecR protein
MRVFIVSIILMLSGGVAHASVGVFSDVDGSVTILRGDNYLAAQPGVEVEQQDIVETAADAAAQLDMEDGSLLKLGPDTQLSVSEYRLDNDRNVIAAGIDVLAGWVRFAVAKLRDNGRYTFHTPVLTVGVRGTEGVVDAQNDSGDLDLTEGSVEISAVGDDARGLAPVRVSAGEFIQRRRGRGFERLHRAPPAFLERMPARMRVRLERRAMRLHRRAVPPRVIRRINREDALRFMERHPYLRERLRERFRPIGVRAPHAGASPAAPMPESAPGRGRAMTPAERARYLRQHPQARGRLERRRQVETRADGAAAARPEANVRPPTEWKDGPARR